MKAWGGGDLEKIRGLGIFFPEAFFQFWRVLEKNSSEIFSFRMSEMLLKIGWACYMGQSSSG